MLIQCPACKANAEVPASKEGAKVRCGECSRVYQAVALGQRGRKVSSGTNTGLWIGLGVAGVMLLIFIALGKSGGSDPVTTASVEAEEPEQLGAMIDTVGWDSEIVQVVRRIHKAAGQHDTGLLMNMIEPAHYHAWRAQVAAAENEEEVDLLTGVEAYRALPGDQQLTVQNAAVADLVEGEAKELVADWAPYDGAVADLSDDYAVVHVSVTPTGGGTEKRTVEWELVRDGRKWKAFRWERWYSDAEKRANRKRRQKGYDKVTLSDGSVVFEREPEPLDHLEDTPAELRAKIDRLVQDVMNDEPKIFREARKELVAIGKPAMPKLLTCLYEIPLDNEENAIRLNAVVVTMRDITGQNFFFKPLAIVGSAMGTSEERRQSAIKQWFAWWYRKGERFTEKETADALEDLIKLDEKDKAWLERNKD